MELEPYTLGDFLQIWRVFLSDSLGLIFGSHCE